MVWWKFGYGSDGPVVTETADGKWRVTLTLDSDKDIKTEEMKTSESWSDIDGEVLNEPLEIGFYADTPKKLWSAWSALEQVRVTKSEQVFTFELDEKPAHIAIEPRRLLQERNVDDNVKAIKESSALSR